MVIDVASIGGTFRDAFLSSSNSTKDCAAHLYSSAIDCCPVAIINRRTCADNCNASILLVHRWVSLWVPQPQGGARGPPGTHIQQSTVYLLCLVFLLPKTINSYLHSIGQWITITLAGKRLAIFTKVFSLLLADPLEGIYTLYAAMND